MRSYNLNIAGYYIRFESSDDGPDLVPSERFLRSICSECKPDVLIRIHSGLFDPPKEAERVFHAPFAEEINGIRIQHKTNFWSIWKYNSDLYIRTIFPLSSSGKNAILKFSLEARDWDLWIDGAGKEIDPFEYPLDGLILYYLAVIHKDIMIHASGINISGNGYLFSGISGKGKTTIAKLSEEFGAKVIHDDRLILTNTRGVYRMFNTPVYSSDEPLDSILNRIFIIDHGNANKMVPLKGASAISLVMANCIQHNWSANIIATLMDSVSTMCGTIPVFRLFFKPDGSVINYILENE
jgi:hypothetical protein